MSKRDREEIKMSGRIRARLTELAITLPSAAPPIASYVPFTRSGNTVYISGQIPRNAEGKPIVGTVGKDTPVEAAAEAAKICAISIVAQLNAACDGDLDRVKQFLKLGVFVNCTPDFTQHPTVGNGASDTLVAIFGDKGKHARSAVGTSSLPLGVCVEVDAIVEIEP